MRKFIALAVFALTMAAAAPPAQASTFVWKDAENGYTMSFPDVWRIQTPDDVYTRLRIAGPLGEDHATCRMQVRHDGRLAIYPKYLLDEAVSETLDRDYWEKRVSEFDNAEITDYYNPASLGAKGDATAVRFTFEKDTGDGISAMKGVMMSSLYGKNRYEFTCSAKAEVFERWGNLFLSIADSVELHSRYHPFPTGYYRSFLLDPKLILPNQKPGTRDPKADKGLFWRKNYYR